MKLKADVQNIQKASEKLADQNVRIYHLENELDDVMSNLGRQSEFGSYISAIRAIQSNLEDERYQLFNLGLILSEIGTRYSQTETAISENLDGTDNKFKLINATVVNIKEVAAKLEDVLNGR